MVIRMKSKYRRNRRRYSGRRRNEKNRSKITAVLIMIFIAVVVVGSVFLGRYLKEKAEISEANRLNDDTGISTDTSFETEQDDILYDKVPPYRIDIGYVPIGSISEAALESETAVILRDRAGTLYYSSPVAQSLGGQSAENGLLSVSDTIAPLVENGCYISACVVLSEHSEENGITVDAIHAFEQALIGEIASSGVSEILLCGFDSMDAERVKMLCGFSEAYRASSQVEVPLGLLIPYSFFSQTDANELCRELSKHYEFLAADYTDIVPSEAVSMNEAVHDRIDSMQMYLSRYALRVVLSSEDENVTEAKAALAEAAIYSVQTLARSLLAPETKEDKE